MGERIAWLRSLAAVLPATFFLSIPWLLTLAACGSSPAPLPTIVSFTAAKTPITAGTATTLTAVFSGGSGKVDQGLGTIRSGSPLSTGNLTTTRTFTLIITGAGQSQSSQVVTVTVLPSPVITSFTATPSSIIAGNSSTLTCHFTGGTGLITPGDYPVVDGQSLTVTPQANTKYTLSVTNELGDVAQAEVSVGLGVGLVLTITGLPEGLAPEITLTGPDGSSRVVTASQILLGLPDGEYLISAAPVTDTNLPGLGREKGGLLGLANLQRYPLRSVQRVNTNGGAVPVRVAYPPARLTVAIPNLEDAGVSAAMDFVLVPDGNFIMGSDTPEDSAAQCAQPAHAVALGEAFYMASTELTQGQWKAVMGSTSNPSAHLGDALPLEGVSWNALRAAGTGFLDRMNIAMPGYGFRLPSEIEWECACRAGTGTAYYFGEDPTDLSAYAAWGASGTTVVASFAPNPWGLYDMLGNVWEWVEDDAHLGYAGSPVDGSAWVDAPRCSFRILRGGSWLNGDALLRSAIRGYSWPEESGGDIGVRLVLAVPKLP